MLRLILRTISFITAYLHQWAPFFESINKNMSDISEVGDGVILEEFGPFCGSVGDEC